MKTTMTAISVLILIMLFGCLCSVQAAVTGVDKSAAEQEAATAFAEKSACCGVCWNGQMSGCPCRCQGQFACCF